MRNDDQESGTVLRRAEENDDGAVPADEPSGIGSHERRHEHAVISAFDLFSIGGTSCPSRLEPRALRKRVLIRMFDISVYPRQSMGDYDVDMKYTLFPGFIGVMLWNGMCGSGSE